MLGGMHTLYRMPHALPTGLGLMLTVVGCSDEVPQQQVAQTPSLSPVYVEALQNAEAARYSLQQIELQEQRINVLFGRDAPHAAER